MKVIVNAGDLATIIDVARRACGRASNNPILPCILLDASQDTGVLSATGTDVRTRARHGLETLIERPGAVCLPPAAIVDFLEAVPTDGMVDIDVDAANKAVFRSGRTVARIAGLSNVGFPPGDDDMPAVAIQVPPDRLRAMIQSVVIAASRDDATRPVLSGVHIQVDQAWIRMTAADGVRLATRMVEIPAPAPAPAPEFDVIVPADPLADVAAGLEKASGSVTLGTDMGLRHLTVMSDSGTWTIQLLAGPFPAKQEHFSQPIVAAWMVSRADLLRACKLVTGVLVSITGTDGKTSQQVTKAVLEQVDDGLRIYAGDMAADHMASTVIDAITDNAPYQVAVNGDALRMAAEALQGQGPIRIGLFGPQRGVYLTDANDQTSAHLHMIVQMAVSNVSQRDQAPAAATAV